MPSPTSPIIAQTDLDQFVFKKLFIEQLVPGPLRFECLGLIVNLSHHQITSKSPEAAKGCQSLLLADGTGTLLVRTMLIVRGVALTRT